MAFLWQLVLHILGAIHKRRRPIFPNLWPPLPPHVFFHCLCLDYPKRRHRFLGAPLPLLKKTPTLHVCQFSHIFKLMNLSIDWGTLVLVNKKKYIHFALSVGLFKTRYIFSSAFKDFCEFINYVGFAPNKVPTFISFHRLLGGFPSLPLWGDLVYGWP